MYKNVYFVWREYQSRVEFMEKDFGFKTFYLPTPNNKILKLIKYAMNIFTMLTILIKNKPEIIWLQLPPSFLMPIPLLVRGFFKKRAMVIADCHNGLFSKKWFSIPFTKTLLNKCDVILVHNEDIFKHAIRLGVNSEKLFILEDKPNLDVTINKDIKIHNTEKIVLFPASFNVDEPIEVLLETCKKMENFKFVITGKYQNKVDMSRIPKNVTLTGWLPKEEYIKILEKSDILLGLTLYDGIQLSVANEGVSYEKPMVLSSTDTLKKLFYKGVVFTDNNPDSLKSNIIYAYQNSSKLKGEIKKLKIERIKKWNNQANIIKQFINREGLYNE
ncbi:glycosyltransferase [Caldifermentibacillus hisashii]|uniref:glycosyltransferase n=1 Tax=Caldifermentibacillus hisashii TaxID=996558 RepID=UPI000BA4DDCA|nr:glycosyltransferase [Caldifermentibacillus hisashii]PAC34380.1 hypothetical protein CEJ87_13725 [Caldifermentibacillus hisashii]